MRKSMLAGLLALTLVLSGCGGKGDASASGSGSGNASGSASGSEPVNVPTAEEVQTARKTLEDAVESLRTTGTLPGFEEVLNLPLGEASYRYDIADVDGDGYEELYLVQDGGYMAAMVALILDGQGGKLRAELSEFPTLTAYDNGCIRADASHNPGLAGDFWPYTLYVYDPESDLYRDVGSVDAWSRDFQPQNYPVDTDTSNSGFVYYVYRDMGTEYGLLSPVDESQYLQWREEYLSGAAELELPWQSLTAEHIQTLTAAG